MHEFVSEGPTTNQQNKAIDNKCFVSPFDIRMPLLVFAGNISWHSLIERYKTFCGRTFFLRLIPGEWATVWQWSMSISGSLMSNCHSMISKEQVIWQCTLRSCWSRLYCLAERERERERESKLRHPIHVSYISATGCQTSFPEYTWISKYPRCSIRYWSQFWLGNKDNKQWSWDLKILTIPNLVHQYNQPLDSLSHVCLYWRYLWQLCSSLVLLAWDIATRQVIQIQRQNARSNFCFITIISYKEDSHYIHHNIRLNHDGAQHKNTTKPALKAWFMHCVGSQTKLCKHNSWLFWSDGPL